VNDQCCMYSIGLLDHSSVLLSVREYGFSFLFRFQKKT